MHTRVQQVLIILMKVRLVVLHVITVGIRTKKDKADANNAQVALNVTR